VKTAETVSVLREGGTVALGRVRRGMAAFARRVWLGGFVAAGVARRFRKPLLVAACVGTALALTCYLAGLTVSSVVNGVAGFVGVLAGSLLVRLRRILQRVDLEGWDVSRIP
jgi:hypothetical protein